MSIALRVYLYLNRFQSFCHPLEQDTKFMCVCVCVCGRGRKRDFYNLLCALLRDVSRRARKTQLKRKSKAFLFITVLCGLGLYNAR